MIKFALLDKKGAAFEQFFTAAAIELWGDDFEPWKPQGKYGDYKCDGYRRSTQTVFQCNAPEQFVARDVEGKIEKDFEGARAAFGDRMKAWIFVHNQKETPANANALVHKLREKYPDIDISIWTSGHLAREILALADAGLANLVPGFSAGQDFSSDLYEFLERRFEQSRPPIPVVELEPADNTNINAFNEAVEDLGEEDKEVRRRLLGYSQWFDPATKEEVIGRIVARGYSEEVILVNAERLQQAGLIKITDNHYLSIAEEVGQQAAETLVDEFLEELEA